MEPVASIFDKLKKSGEDFFAGLNGRRENSARRNPIEILKRLQREAFADLMKLRDRQDKVERILTLSRTSKGGPFQDDDTHVRGEVDVMGGLFLVDDLDEQRVDAIGRAGIRARIDSRIIFETRMRQKDTLEAEFVSSQNSQRDSGELLGRPLSLARVCYVANISYWFSLVGVPIGARCRDVIPSKNYSSQEHGLTDYSSFGPPLLHQNNGSAIALMVKKPNVIGSLAQFVSELPSSMGLGHSFSTFGQVICQLPRSTQLSLFGLLQVPKFSQHVIPGVLTIPLGIFQRRKPPSEATPEAFPPPLQRDHEDCTSTGSLALMLESELDESTSVRGWIQMRNSNPRHVQWAISMSDFEEDEIGWGLSLGGSQGPLNRDHVQFEAFLRFNVGKRLTVQPGLTYIVDGTNQMPALMFRSSWSL